MDFLYSTPLRFLQPGLVKWIINLEFLVVHWVSSPEKFMVIAYISYWLSVSNWKASCLLLPLIIECVKELCVFLIWVCSKFLKILNCQLVFSINFNQWQIWKSFSYYLKYNKLNINLASYTSYTLIKIWLLLNSQFQPPKYDI